MRGQTGKATGGRKRHRATENARNWHQHGGFTLRLVPPKTSSWWIAGAQPEDFAKFTALAQERDREHTWSAVEPIKMNSMKGGA